MSWFLLALVGPFLYALTNHLDKILLEKYFKEGGVGTLILFSSLLSVLAVPIIYLMEPLIFEVSLIHIGILAFVGILNILVLWFYLLALQNDEASVTVVFYQLVPVIGLVLGYIVLGEVISMMQFLAMMIIILGTTIISFEIDEENNFHLRKSTIAYMVAASFFWALESVIFKMVALEETVLQALFWEHVMMVVIGTLLFLLVPLYRSHFLSALRGNSVRILSLNVTNEGIYMLGNIALAFAVLLAPVALILLGQSFQPIFVFAIGIFLTIFFPKVTKEKIHLFNIWQKVFAIIITGIGTFLLLFVSP